MDKKTVKVMGIRTKLFLYMLCMILAMTCMVDIIVYRIYKQDIERKVSSFQEEIIMELAENMAGMVKSLEENMMYKITSSGIFDYQQDLPSASAYDIERRMQNFAALMTTKELQVRSVYIRDQYGCSFYYDKAGSSHERLQEFMKTEAACYIRDHYESIKNKRGSTLWRRFADDPDNLYLIKSTLNQNALTFEGILCVVIKREYLENVERNLSCRLAIYDEAGGLLYCSSGIEPIALNYQEGGRQGEASGVFQDYMITQMPLDKKKWTLAGIMSNDQILSSMRELLRRMLLIEGGFLLLSLLAAAWISRSMTYNISALIENFRRIGKGEEAVLITCHSHDETAYLCGKFNEMYHQLLRNVEQMAENSTQREKAEYNALMAQMNPHFLYNTLEAVSSMAKLNGQKEIVGAVQRLSKLLRASISGECQEIRLREELEYTGQYLELQKLLSGGRIEWEIVAEEEQLDCLVPKLILQPIVENAILHGLKDMLEDAMLIIMARRRRERLILEISDNGSGMAQELADRILLEEEPEELRRDRAHIGIKSIQRRIAILYGADYGVTMESEEGGGTVVRISLPYVKSIKNKEGTK